MPAIVRNAWTRLQSLALQKPVMVPTLAGAGGYCLAASYSPSRWVRPRYAEASEWSSYIPAEINPLLIAVGVALLAAALVIALRRD